MRLLYLNSQGTFCLTDNIDVSPRYAILSHTWGADSDEVTYKDIRAGRGGHKSGGYAKLKFCAAQARKDGIDHFWIDTCCINKNSETELSEAIRSMFRWYRDAEKCYVFLSDVTFSQRDVNGAADQTWEESLRCSRWFTRGWTLQELLAPRAVEFFSQDRVLLGSREALLQQLHKITEIPMAALRGASMTSFSIEERFTWAKKRETKKAEDQAYCLFGIFDVQLPVLYGEGQKSAIQRLKKEVGVTSADIDGVIWKTYRDGRLKVERLSGELLPLDGCFINLSIVHHRHDSDMSSTDDESSHDRATKRLSRFSLAARLKVETPPQSGQVSFASMFEPRKQRDGSSVRPQRVLIWGRAGMGKTTLCKKIVHEVCDNSLWKALYDRVIWLPLRQLKRTDSHNIVELLQSEFDFTGLGERVQETLNKLVQDSRTLFLLDGLDEVSLLLEPDSPGQSLLHKLLSQPHVIITSRPHPHNTRVLEHKPADLELETVGFSPPQIEEYLHRVAQETKMTDKVVEEIRSFIQQRPLVQSLAGIPVQLDAICYTWNMRSFSRDNATMTSLYLEISQSLWKSSALRLGKKVDGNLVTRQQLDFWSWRRCEKLIKAEAELLQELAFRGLYQEIVEFGVEDVEILETSQQMSEDKMMDLAFLRVSDSSVKVSDRTFHFLHLTYQEFFAAQYFVRHWTSDRALQPLDNTVRGDSLYQLTESVAPEEFLRSGKYVDRYDIFWRFVVGLLRAEHNRKHLYRFLNALEGEPVDLIGLAHQRLVVHCLTELDQGGEELRHRTRKVEDQYVTYAVYQSGVSKSEHYEPQRWLSRANFLNREAECSKYVLTKLLDKKETEAEVLETLCHRSAISIDIIEVVSQKLGEGVGEHVRKLAIQIIGQHCSHEQQEKVVQLIGEPQRFNTTLREIAYAWSRTSKLLEPAVEVLVRLLQHSDSDVRSQAVSALSRQASLPDTAVEALVRLLQDSDSNVRYWAASALSRQASLPDTAVEALVRLLQDSDSNVRSQAASALSRQASLPDTAVEALVRLLQHSDSDVRYRAASALGEQASLPDTAVEALVRLLQDSDSDVWHRAASALGRQASLPDTAVEALVRLLQDSDSDVRYWAASALSRQASLPDTAVEALVRLLQHSDSDVRYRAASALDEQASLPDTAVEALVRLLQDSDSNVRSQAASALGRQASLPDTAVEALVRLLQDSDSNIRSQAASALSRQASLPDTAVEALVRLLQDSDSNVRYWAVSALSRQASLPDTAVEALVRLLQHSDSNVRYWAASALSRQASLPDTAVEALVRLLQHSDSDVWSRAVSALSGQASLPDTAVEALVRLLQHSDSDVRYWAASALSRRASLPNTAVKLLAGLLYNSSKSVDDNVTHMIVGRQEIQALLPTFHSQALRCFIKDWFKIGSAICTIERDHLYIRASGRVQKLPLQSQQVEAFMTEWDKARHDLGLPSLLPV